MLTLNPKVKGIPLGDPKINIISQFADDATLFLKNTKECIEEATKTLTQVQENTGLTVSFDKSRIIRIGSLKYSGTEVNTNPAFQWTDDDRHAGHGSQKPQRSIKCGIRLCNT